jgi:hypothetical protein
VVGRVRINPGSRGCIGRGPHRLPLVRPNGRDVIRAFRPFASQTREQRLNNMPPTASAALSAFESLHTLTTCQRTCCARTRWLFLGSRFVD